MKRLLLVLMVGLAFGACKKSSTDDSGNWISESSFEGLPRSSAVSFVLDNQVYVGLGYNVNEDNAYMKDFWRLNPTNNSWTKVADFPGDARSGAVAFVANQKAYVGTGYNGKDRLKDFYEYDATANVWTRIADFAGSARYSAVAFALNEKGYVGTGDDGNDTRDFYQYDPTTNQWVQSVSVGGSKRKSAVTFTIDGKAYVCTGIDNGVNLTDLWSFDPGTALWTEKALLTYNSDWTIVRSYGVAFTLNNKAYVGLGYNSGVRSDMWEYDPVLDTWEVKTAFEGVARQEAVAFVLGAHAYVGLGRSGSTYFDDIKEFKPNDSYNDED